MADRSLLVSGGALGGAPSSLQADGGFVVTTTSLLPHTRLPLHAHERASLNVVLAGHYEERIGARRAVVPPGACVVKPGGVTHANVIGDAVTHCLVVELDPARLDAIGTRSTVCDDVRLLRDAAFGLLAVRILREVRSPDTVTPLALAGLALDLVAVASRAALASGPGAEPRWLRGVVDRLTRAARGGPVPTLHELAYDAGVHPAHVARVFRRHHRTSVGEFVRARRAEHAALLLAETDRPLARIALDLGFADQSHFTRSFRQRVGVTPAEYRRCTGTSFRACARPATVSAGDR